MKNFQDCIEQAGQVLVKDAVRCLQVNMGYRCNLRCSHCHLKAGPDRQEMMDRQVVDACLGFAARAGVTDADITGGAPEANPHLPYLISGLRQVDSVRRISLRTNLAILEEEEYSQLPEYFAANEVELIASMPCYLEENVEVQRGKGVYHKNIRILQRLNLLGYGTGAAGLKLHLAYNPAGNFLPGPQQELEAAYRQHLKNAFGVSFNNLFTITNMPIGRFRDQLEKQGLLTSYLQLLRDSYNPANLDRVMCRQLVSVDWQGRLYDCDFNQILNLPGAAGTKAIGQVGPDDLSGKPVRVGNHCFACVAGAGSSCQGSLAAK